MLHNGEARFAADEARLPEHVRAAVARAVARAVVRADVVQHGAGSKGRFVCFNLLVQDGPGF